MGRGKEGKDKGGKTQETLKGSSSKNRRIVSKARGETGTGTGTR